MASEYRSVALAAHTLRWKPQAYGRGGHGQRRRTQAQGQRTGETGRGLPRHRVEGHQRAFRHLRGNAGRGRGDPQAARLFEAAGQHESFPDHRAGGRVHRTQRHDGTHQIRLTLGAAGRAGDHRDADRPRQRHRKLPARHHRPQPARRDHAAARRARRRDQGAAQITRDPAGRHRPDHPGRRRRDGGCRSTTGRRDTRRRSI